MQQLFFTKESPCPAGFHYFFKNLKFSCRQSVGVKGAQPRMVRGVQTFSRRAPPHATEEASAHACARTGSEPPAASGWRVRERASERTTNECPAPVLLRGGGQGSTQHSPTSLLARTSATRLGKPQTPGTNLRRATCVCFHADLTHNECVSGCV